MPFNPPRTLITASEAVELSRRRPPNYEEDLSPEERGLMRSQELTELRDRQAQQAAKPTAHPPPQPPLTAPARPATAGGGLMPEGFTQVGRTVIGYYITDTIGTLSLPRGKVRLQTGGLRIGPCHHF